jgi:hypothetical protein
MTLGEQCSSVCNQSNRHWTISVEQKHSKQVNIHAANICRKNQEIFFAVKSSDLKWHINDEQVNFGGTFCPIHPERLLCLLQDHDSYLLRLQLAHPEPPSGSGMARWQWVGWPRQRAGGGVHLATAAGGRTPRFCRPNHQYQPAHGDTGDFTS